MHEVGSIVSVDTVLALIGLVIVTGFLSSFLFEKARIPDVLLLLGIGIVVGHWVGPQTQTLAATFAPYFGAIAIVMILFEGGLHLDFGHIAGQVKNALILALIAFVLTAAFTTAAAMSWLGWRLMPSMMFGAILGCTSSAIVIPTVQRGRAPKDIKALTMLESVFSDTLAIVVLFTLLDLEMAVGGSSGPRATVYGRLYDSVTVALAIGMPVGLLWLNVLQWTRDRPLSYLWTFAVLMLVYAGVHGLGGSGALAVFFLAVVIGNSRYLPRWLVWRRRHAPAASVDAVAYGTVKWFHTELTFLIRSFFFVYIGLLFRVAYVQGTYLWTMIGFTIIILVMRAVAVWCVQRTPGPMPRALLWAFSSRGLVSAVLATMPVAAGMSGSEEFLAYTVPIIISTNVIMTLWVFGWEQRHGAQAAATDALVDPAPTPAA